MNFITYSELSKDIVCCCDRIPRDIDVVVGVPRSGMLVASMIGLYINKPICDLESFCEKRLYSVGRTKNTSQFVKKFSDVKKILLCEDSVNTGFSIENAKAKVSLVYKNEIVVLAAYVVPEKKNKVDIYCREVNCPRMFEWNYLHHPDLIRACFDIDGVLCVDPTREENDNGARYVQFLLNARPKLIPTRKVGYIVTSRLEVYRKETEQWLKNHNIEYKELIMYPGSFEDRRKNNDHGKFKAKVYKELSNAVLFFESEPWQAEEIRSLSGKQVICTSSVNNYSASSLSIIIRRIKQSIPDSVFGIPISKKMRKRNKIKK